ncbi:unnamed protein product, partial [Mesorhabditis belari]|uniref:Uncharacterized protein n=1 Tax=Mesorhabditis belari TaxID=2138241 RepID=A0AAF3F117_9BILA
MLKIKYFYLLILFVLIVPSTGFGRLSYLRQLLVLRAGRDPLKDFRYPQPPKSSFDDFDVNEFFDDG